MSTKTPALQDDERVPILKPPQISHGGLSSHQHDQYGTLALHPSSELEQLAGVETIRFKQELQMVQLVCGCDMPINFNLINEQDQIIYRIEEQENCCVRNCIPQGLRSESSMIMTNGLQALRFSRETRCIMNCCLPCCCYPLPFSRERLTVSSYTGVIYGTIRHDLSAWRSRLSVLNEVGSVVMTIEGPGCNFGFFGDLHYKIINKAGVEIGNIIKHWNGCFYEMLTDFDDFTLNFPRDLDIPVKATLIGAVKLINFLFFQGSIRRLFAGLVCSACQTAIKPHK